MIRGHCSAQHRYFVTEPSSPWVDQKPVIRDVKFNGGLGKTGLPVLSWIRLALTFCALAVVVWGPLIYWGQQQHRHYDHLREAIQMGLSAAQEGLSQERLKTRLEQWYRNLPYFRRRFKEELMVVADATFTGATQNQMTL